jgi:predicted DNA binding protein
MTRETGPPEPPQETFKGHSRTQPAASLPRTSDRIAIMKLEVKVPQKDWVGEFTRRHPELIVVSLNILVVAGEDLLGEYEIYGPPVDWTSELARSPDVVEVESINVGPGLGRYRIRSRKTILLDLATKLELIARYPRTVKNGVLECEVIARLSQMRRLIEAAANYGIEPRVVSLRRDSLRFTHPNLTPVQDALFRQALAMGYFDVPRRITLTRLAERVSRTKSSVSTTLAVVERKLAEQFAGTPAA